jgi:hypothetical protein
MERGPNIYKIHLLLFFSITITNTKGFIFRFFLAVKEWLEK